MHRRVQRPGLAQRGGSREKGGPAEPSDHALGRSRGGFGTKLHLVVCGNAIPLGAHVSAGQDHESKHVEAALGSVALPYAWTAPWLIPRRVAGDTAYTGEPIRGMLDVLGVEPVIAHHPNETPKPWEGAFDREAYRRRNVIERVVGYLKECRRVATRFEKLALSYLAMVKLAMIHRCLRISFSYGT